MLDALTPLRDGIAGAMDWRLVRSSLFRKYVALFLAVVTIALLTNGLIEVWFSYREHRTALIRTQQEQAEAAAAKITQFVSEIEGQLGWTTQLPSSAATLDQKRFDGLRLLRQVPAIMELYQLDAQGREQLRVSRLGMDVLGANTDYSRDPRFLVPQGRKIYYGPVYFHNGSEPHMTIAMAGARRDAGVSVAEVNLKFIWDVVSKVHVGKQGLALVIDGQANLIAHPDTSLVLRKTDLTGLAQVRSARSETQERDRSAVATDVRGQRVLTAHAAAKPLDWLVFVELPEAEAYEPLFRTVERSALILLAGLGLAFLAGLFLAQRMIVPIQALREGAANLGNGNLDQRITLRTGDELEDLAVSFNEMADRLQDSYAGLEQKVESRTRELAMASQHKTQFLANMSHELRTPLNAILGYTELILDGIYGEVPEKSRQVLERVQINGRHLLGLINDVLDLTKIEAGQLSLAVEDYDVRALVDGVIASLGSLAGAKGLVLRNTVQADLPGGRADARRLKQVLLNLVGNAIKFTDQGSVEVSAEQREGRLILSVKDTGPGIAEADQKRIFEEFQQVDTSSTRAKGGTGLGLAIARRIVEMHGGQLGLRSTPGAGSTFYFSIPLRIEVERAMA